MRNIIVLVVAMAVLSGCSTKEFNDGVNDGVSGVTRVIQGKN
jgi:uncharacterized protein YceK